MNGGLGREQSLSSFRGAAGVTKRAARVSIATGGGRGPGQARAGCGSKRPAAAARQCAPAPGSSCHHLPAPGPSKTARSASGEEGTAVGQKHLGQRGKKAGEAGRREVQRMRNSRGSVVGGERGAGCERAQEKCSEPPHPYNLTSM